MRIPIKSVTLMILGSLLLVSGAEAQAGGGAGAFKWYVGGHGGITSFRTVEGREWMPTGGGHFLITAKRTALLLSVDQGFGDDELAVTQYEIRDSVDNVTESGVVGWTFDGIRRYSAILLAYPIQNRNVQPYVGVGGGIAHYTGNSQGPFADRNVEDELSSTGFATAVAGLEFRVGPLSAFGHYQVTTRHGFKQTENVLLRNMSGDVLESRLDFGEWTRGAHHSVTGGLRFSLGGSREAVKTGGYK
jgi:hypothetical protein